MIIYILGDHMTAVIRELEASAPQFPLNHLIRPEAGIVAAHVFKYQSNLMFYPFL